MCGVVELEWSSSRGVHMASTAQEVFVRDVRDLPLAERLRLASLILEEVTQSGVAIVEQSENWSEQDKQDIAAFSLEHASRTYPEVEDIVQRR